MEGPSGLNRTVQLTIHAVVPFAAFLFMLVITARVFFWSSSDVCLCLMIGLLVCAFQYYIAQDCLKNKSWQKWIGFYSAIALIIGFGAGLLIHYGFMLYYYKYKYMTRYTNVAASQPPVQFEDASNILFSQGTQVDTSKAIGYHDIRTSKLLCVAPVIDGSMAKEDPIKFWAVGTGCCTHRGSFHCDDAANSAARTGLLIFRPDHLVSDSMRWAVEGNFDFEGFNNAITMAASIYSITIGEDMRYIRWVNNADATIDKYRQTAVERGIYAALLWLMYTTCGILKEIYYENRRQAELADQITGIAHA